MWVREQDRKLGVKESRGKRMTGKGVESGDGRREEEVGEIGDV